MWTLAHQIQQTTAGQTLRIITEKAVVVQWSFDGWVTGKNLETYDAGFGCWSGDLPSAKLLAGCRVVFTILWQGEQEGKVFQVVLFENRLRCLLDIVAWPVCQDGARNNVKEMIPPWRESGLAADPCERRHQGEQVLPIHIGARGSLGLSTEQ